MGQSSTTDAMPFGYQSCDFTFSYRMLSQSTAVEAIQQDVALLDRAVAGNLELFYNQSEVKAQLVNVLSTIRSKFPQELWVSSSLRKRNKVILHETLLLLLAFPSSLSLSHTHTHSTPAERCETREVTLTTNNNSSSSSTNNPNRIIPFQSCTHATCNVQTFCDRAIDIAVLTRASLLRTRLFIREGFNQETALVADGLPDANPERWALYDFPKSVQASLAFRLIGTSDTMTESQQESFLRAMEATYGPILTENYYLQSRISILLQQGGNINPGADPRLPVNPRDLYNRVSVLFRAHCGGDSCTDDNFHAFLLREGPPKVDEVLSRSQADRIPGSAAYFQQSVMKIEIKDDEMVVVEPLKPPADIDTDAIPGTQSSLDGWLWPVTFLCVLVFLVAGIFTCIQYRHRQQLEQRTMDKVQRLSSRSQGQQYASYENNSASLSKQRNNLPQTPVGGGQPARVDEGGQNTTEEEEQSPKESSRGGLFGFGRRMKRGRDPPARIPSPPSGQDGGKDEDECPI